MEILLNLYPKQIKMFKEIITLKWLDLDKTKFEPGMEDLKCELQLLH